MPRMETASLNKQQCSAIMYNINFSCKSIAVDHIIKTTNIFR